MDFRDSTPDAYRRAFYHLLCGLADKAPGPEVQFLVDLEMPEPVCQKGTPSPLLGSEQIFLGQVFEQLAVSRQPLMLLAQAERSQADIVQALLEHARRRYGEANTLHITPPYSSKADHRDYFSYLGRQCQFGEPTTSAVRWENALHERLHQGRSLLLLVSHFEHGAETERRDLAGILRSLSEEPTRCLHIVLCGGQRLAELRYGSADMSFLNHAAVLCWPELTEADVLTWQARDYPGLSLSEQEVQELLVLCGGHPHLLRICLQQRQQQSLLVLEEAVAEMFIRYRANEVDRKRVCAWLEKDDLGVFDRWPVDALLRQLYWDNLLKSQQKRLVWRCELMRTVGRKVLRYGE